MRPRTRRGDPVPQTPSLRAARGPYQLTCTHRAKGLRVHLLRRFSSPRDLPPLPSVTPMGLTPAFSLCSSLSGIGRPTALLRGIFSGRSDVAPQPFTISLAHTDSSKLSTGRDVSHVDVYLGACEEAPGRPCKWPPQQQIRRRRPSALPTTPVLARSITRPLCPWCWVLCLPQAAGLAGG